MILHIDMDAFFAAVEQRDNPVLKGKPIIISGNSKRSVVSTASYEARKFGIRSAMPVFQAKEKCRELIIVPGNMRKYRDNSMKIMSILTEFSPMVEQVSIDEAYLDIRGTRRLFGEPFELANKIKQRIRDELSLTCSIGIAPVKFLAKIASDMQKPDGLTILPHEKIEQFIQTLPIQKVPGVGKRAMQQMAVLKIKTLGDINRFPAQVLEKKFGKMGLQLMRLAKGEDGGTVQTEHVRKSISSETTLDRDISNFDTARQILLDLSQRVGRQLRKKENVCRTVSIKLKFSDFTQITRSHTSESPISSSNAIFDEAVALYEKVKLKKKIRLIGVGVSGLVHKDAPYQMQLLCGKKEDDRQWTRVDHALDRIGEKFGTGIVNKASLKTLDKGRSSS